MMKKILVIIVLFLSPLMATATVESDLKGLLTTKINTITSILENKKISKEQKEEKIISGVEDIFDFTLMAKLSLGGSEWKKISEADKKLYNDLFVKKVKNSYFEKLHSYSNEKVEIKEPKKNKDDRIYISSLVLGKGQPIEVLYKFYLTDDKKKWLIYDLEIEGVSIVQTYRTQFAEILSNSNFKAIIDKLSAKK